MTTSMTMMSTHSTQKHNSNNDCLSTQRHNDDDDVCNTPGHTTTMTPICSIQRHEMMTPTYICSTIDETDTTTTAADATTPSLNNEDNIHNNNNDDLHSTKVQLQLWTSTCCLQRHDDVDGNINSSPHPNSTIVTMLTYSLQHTTLHDNNHRLPAMYHRK